MKKYTFALLVLPLFFMRCSGGAGTGETTASDSTTSASIEKAALDCWSKNWSKTAGFDITTGINKTDDYLFDHGYLGKRYVDDYRRFFTGVTQVYIPDTVPGSADMIATLNSDFSGAPDIDALQNCWKTSWFDKMNSLDSNDVIRRVGKMVQKLAQTGPPEISAASDEFFAHLTQEELNRPLVKAMAYFIFWKTSYGQTHIVFRQPEVSSNSGVDSLKH